MGEWKTYRLGDICTLVAGFAFKSKDFGDYPDKVIKIADIQPPIVDMSSLTGVDISQYNSQKLEKYKIQKGDYVLAMTGATIGKLGRILSEKNAYINQRVLLFKPIDKYIDKNYLYYYLCQNIFYSHIRNHIDSETAQPNISANSIGEFTLTLPPLEEQRRIAGILGSLDDKIELNRRINANLEAQAQALFRSWFVDFEPFRDGPFVDSELGKIPQGWKICRLKDATKEIIRGFTSKYVERSDLINLNQKVNKGQYLDRQYYKFLNPEIAIPTNKFAQQNDILLNSLGQGTLGRVHYYGELTPNIVIDQHITIIRANNTTFQPSFIYLFLSSNKVQHSIEGMVTGSTGMQMLNISQVREMNILQPDVNTMNKFHNIVQPFFVEIRKNNSETEIIAKIRDTLLPKLMAGEIKI